MKLIEIIKQLNILDGNEIRIDEAKYLKYSQKLDINFVLKYAIDLKTYNRLFEEVNKVLKPLEDNIEYTFSFGYEDEYLNKDSLKEYLIEIINKLSQNSSKYNALDCNLANIDGNNIEFKMAYDALGFDDLSKPIEYEFMEYGLNIHVSIVKDETKSVQDEIKRLDMEMEMELKKAQEEAMMAQKFNSMSKEIKKSYVKMAPKSKTSIKNIPLTNDELVEYININGNSDVMIEGYVFGADYRPTKSKTVIGYYKVSDDTDSIIVKKFLKTEEEQNLFKTEIVNNKIIKVIGKIDYDTFDRKVLINASSIEVLGTVKEEKMTDEAPEKRVELHAHTKMSNLDAIVETSDYMKTAQSCGWSSIAITDTNTVIALAEVGHLTSKFPDLKVICGAEMSFVRDDKFEITFNNPKEDIDLKESEYTVFDIEATGLTQKYDKIIQIAAIKVKNGMIVDKFNEMINPEFPLPEFITELTSITDSDLEGKDTIDKVLPRFIEFAKGTILVAHNARYDVGFIYSEANRLNIEFETLPVIDTLNLFRACYYNEVKRFGLAYMAKYFKVKEEHHHLADDDAKVTAECFIHMQVMMYQKKILTFNQINSLIDGEFYKYVFPGSVTILAKNANGYKNLLKIVSDASTNHLYHEAILLKSVLDKYREDILIGSSTLYGDVFDLAFRDSDARVKEEMAYYDYVEVMPPSCYEHLYSSLKNGKKDIEDVIKRIIKIAKELNKTVVAVSDSHYLRPKEKKYRDILIATPQIGGGLHPLSDYDISPSMHLRTTNEMLEEFDFLDNDLKKEIVITNTNLIASQIEKYELFKHGTFAPADDEFKDTFLNVPSIVEEVKSIIATNLEKKYGTNPHPIVTKRLNRELNGIIKSGYASVYYMSYLMVKKSLDDGYIVGSRGSVGSSFVATMMNITEVNPLTNHYLCPKCKFHSFRMSDEEVKEYGFKEGEEALQPLLRKAKSGFDLPDMNCPICGTKMKKDGHDIPFETFLGFEGDKTPDIDLNFSGEYQPRAHEYIRTVFGPENAFRAGTVQTIAEKNAFGYVKGYFERLEKKKAKRNHEKLTDNEIKARVNVRDCEIERLSVHLLGVKRSTGQHPGGIVVVPHRIDIYDVTPVQYPANEIGPWRTTSYDYHKFEENLLKLDVLGHDDPTLIRYLMNYVEEHQDEFPFTNAQDIPIDDSNLYRMFNSTDVIGVSENDLGCKVATYGVPEFGTNFVQNMLVETLPKTFAELVKISGLSHGTNVWATNSQELVNGRTEFGNIDFEQTIGCRDDIMVDLIHMGLDPSKAFKIMEFVRKNKKAKMPDGPKDWLDNQAYMREHGVPEWYIWSCGRIEYMFPKAHATAYVMMALRIGWFKVYYPILFYSAWLSKRASVHDVNAYVQGPVAIKARIEEIKAKPKIEKTAKDDDLITSLQIALEMTLRHIKFLPVDINLSDASVFKIENGALRIPFNAVDKLGLSAAEKLVDARNEKPFTSKDDVERRGKLNKSLMQEFVVMHAFGNLPDHDAEVEEGLFAFLND